MTWWEAIIVGLVQGITEFLPISSTAHIILARDFLGISTPGLFLEIWLHLGSLLAVAIYFRKDLWDLAIAGLAFVKSMGREGREGFWWIVYIGIGTVITGVIGIALKDTISDNLTSYFVMGSALLVTGIFLVFVEWVQQRPTTEKELNLPRAIVVGLAQACAVLPGLSRSGTTLIAGLASGLSKENAVRFSFLLALPVIAGSSVIALKDLGEVTEPLGGLSAFSLGLAFLVSAIASWFGIVWLINFLKGRRLFLFAIYCFALGGFLILSTALNG